MEHKVNWKNSDIVDADDMNRIEGNVKDLDEKQIDWNSTIDFEDYANATPPDTSTALEEIKSGTSIRNLFSSIKAFCKGVVTVGQYPEEFSKLLVNNGDANISGKFALDAAYGKTLSDQVKTLNDNLEDYGFASKAKYTSDFNINKSGFYIGFNSANAPKEGSTIALICIMSNANEGVQMAYSYFGDNGTYKRILLRGVWGKWDRENIDLIYKPTHNTDIFTLSSGRYYIYTNCTNIPEASDFFVEITEFTDNSYKLIEAVPVNIGKKYFYKAKKVFGNWGAWEKYTV